MADKLLMFKFNILLSHLGFENYFNYNLHKGKKKIQITINSTFV